MSKPLLVIGNTNHLTGETVSTGIFANRVIALNWKKSS